MGLTDRDAELVDRFTAAFPVVGVDVAPP